MFANLGAKTPAASLSTATTVYVSPLCVGGIVGWCYVLLSEFPYYLYIKKKMYEQLDIIFIHWHRTFRAICIKLDLISVRSAFNKTTGLNCVVCIKML